MTTATRAQHLSQMTLDLLLLGDLSENDALGARKHIETCTECGREFETLERAARLFDREVRARTQPTSQTERRLQPERRLPFQRRRGNRWATTTVTVVFAAAACFVLAYWKGRDSATFRPKGLPTAKATDTIRVECLGGTLAACPRYSVLAFSVGSADPRSFMTAYLVSIASNRPILLLLNEPTTARAAGGGDLLARGARLPQGIDSGSYRIEVLVMSRPQSREQALDRVSTEIIARAQFTVMILP